MRFFATSRFYYVLLILYVSSCFIKHLPSLSPIIVSAFVVVTPVSSVNNNNNNYKINHLYPILTTTTSISGSSSSSSNNVEATNTLVDNIRSMRVKEIKNELQKRNISTKDIFEKEELVQRLLEVMQKENVNDVESTTKSNDQQQQQQQQQQQPNNNVEKTNQTSRKYMNNDDSNNNMIITTPLYFTSMDENVRVAAINSNDEFRGITVEPSKQPYVTIRIQVYNSNNIPSFQLSLLLDTACSGFVIRPEIQQKYNLPNLSSVAATMTGAGGQAMGTGLTTIEKFSLTDSSSSNTFFGPMPAAVQDIGALPSALDGIIGLSFLSQFESIQLDFRRGEAEFYKTASNDKNGNDENLTKIVESNMQMLGSLGIYTVPVYFGTRGPVQMLVDTGASSTFLNWRGIQDLGLQPNSPQIQRLPNFGAMGSDNVAIQLTHRLYVSSTIQIGNNNRQQLPGLVLQNDRLAIDIGNIPVIDNLPGVGGILGIDILMRCKVVQIKCKKEPRSITLYN